MILPFPSGSTTKCSAPEPDSPHLFHNVLLDIFADKDVNEWIESAAEAGQGEGDAVTRTDAPLDLAGANVLVADVRADEENHMVRKVADHKYDGHCQKKTSEFPFLFRFLAWTVMDHPYYGAVGEHKKDKRNQEHHKDSEVVDMSNPPFHRILFIAQLDIVA